MSEQDPILGLVDDLLALLEGSSASALDVRGDGFSIALRRTPSPRPPIALGAPEATAPQADLVHVRSASVGIFTAEREWKVGDRVEQGAALGGVQSLGHVAEVNAPASGSIREMLAANGAPVEFGQPLFVLERD